MNRVFGKDRNIIIGALHFPPLLGFPDFSGYDIALKNALIDLRAFEEGGVDAVFLENNYGLSPEKISTPAAIAFSYLIGEIRSGTKLRLGASVLWNDYETAFALAATHDLSFVRIPVFVDTIKTYCGVIEGNPAHVAQVRRELGVEHVAIFADIHVKHAELLSKHSITESARLAIDSGANAVILTGKWTGDQPDMREMREVRGAIGNAPIFVGSGANRENVHELLSVANGVIVSTALKEGDAKSGERNVKGYEQRVSVEKVREFVNAARG